MKINLRLLFLPAEHLFLFRFLEIGKAKYLHQLSLKDYSQLVGYLQVAKIIDLGLLLLIQKGATSNKLSNDFQEIVRLGKLVMNWTIDINKFNETYNFKTGIISFVPNNGIDWLDTKQINGISSFEELTSSLKLKLF